MLRNGNANTKQELACTGLSGLAPNCLVILLLVNMVILKKRQGQCLELPLPRYYKSAYLNLF